MWENSKCNMYNKNYGQNAYCRNKANGKMLESRDVPQVSKFQHKQKTKHELITLLYNILPVTERVNAI
jgi:hypothetical protein